MPLYGASCPKCQTWVEKEVTLGPRFATYAANCPKCSEKTRLAMVSSKAKSVVNPPPLPSSITGVEPTVLDPDGNALAPAPTIKKQDWRDPFIYIHKVACEKCGETIGFVNSRTSTRTLKMVCSVTCAAGFFRRAGMAATPIKVVGVADDEAMPS